MSSEAENKRPAEDGESTGDPLVSIIVPCYNREGFLRATVETCLRQTYRNIEVVIADDCSQDESVKLAEQLVAEDSRVRLIKREKNGGVAQAFNTGFNNARGEFMTRLAADDLFEENAVELMLRFLQKHPEAGLTYCDCKIVNLDNEVVGTKITTEVAPGTRNFPPDCSIFVCLFWRREVWEKVGQFNPTFRLCEDYEWAVWVLQQFNIIKCPGQPLRYVQHEEQISRVSLPREEIMGAEIYAQYAPSIWMGRKVVGNGHYNAAFVHEERKCPGQAFKHLLISAWYWPFSFRPYKSLVGLCLRVLTGRFGSGTPTQSG